MRKLHCQLYRNKTAQFHEVPRLAPPWTSFDRQMSQNECDSKGSELGSLHRLGSVRLEDNQFSGEIPPELGSLSNTVMMVVQR